MAKKKSNAGRPSKYETNVKPHLGKISEWTSQGATDAEIAKALGIAVSTLCDYKNKYSEFSAAFAQGRQEAVLKIKGALFKKAIGFEYEEKEAVKKGNEIVSVRIFKRYCIPSETAAGMLLRNYEPEWRDKDSGQMDMKQQEIDIKKALAEASNFDIDFNNDDKG